MTSKGRRKPSLHDLTLEFLSSKEDLDAILAEMRNPSDRACALILSSLLDSALVALLSTRMTEITETERRTLFYGESAFLGSLSAKIRLSYALGLISSAQYDDLKVIKDVRNVFAHSTKQIEFSHPLISERCNGETNTAITAQFAHLKSQILR
jgi:mannitol operon repressor